MSELFAAMQDDWAIVVGIDRYAELGDLHGSENDATAFFEWVTSPGGGGVPSEQAWLVLSSNYRGPFPEGMAEPTVAEIESHLNQLVRIAQRRHQAGKGFRVGRRLYLYFAGHGCAPSFEEAALLSANATRLIVYHLTGKSCADWFYKANVFDDVVLIMDCCRQRYEKVWMYRPPWPILTCPDFVDRGRRFYAHATKWSKKARERPHPPGSPTVRGVFSVVLIDGLVGAAYDASTQRPDGAAGRIVADVTGCSLKNYLTRNTAKLFGGDQLADDELGTVPDVIYDESPARAFIFATVEVPSYDVRIRLSPEALGSELQILELRDDGTTRVFTSMAVTATSLATRLPRRFFTAKVANQSVEKAFLVETFWRAENVVDLT